MAPSYQATSGPLKNTTQPLVRSLCATHGGSNPNSDPSESCVTNLGNGEVQMSLDTFQKHYGEVTFGSVPSQTRVAGSDPRFQWVYGIRLDRIQI